MIMRPSFYEPVMVDRAAERARLGLDPNKPVDWFYSADKAPR